MIAGSGGLCLAGVIGPMPGQEFGEAVDRVLGDASQDVAQVGFGVDAVQFARFDQAVDAGGALATGMRAGEEPVTLLSLWLSLLEPRTYRLIFTSKSKALTWLAGRTSGSEGSSSRTPASS